MSSACPVSLDAKTRGAPRVLRLIEVKISFILEALTPNMEDKKRMQTACSLSQSSFYFKGLFKVPGYEKHKALFLNLRDMRKSLK